jgi:hypothetical protein
MEHEDILMLGNSSINSSSGNEYAYMSRRAVGIGVSYTVRAEI